MMQGKGQCFFHVFADGMRFFAVIFRDGLCPPARDPVDKSHDTFAQAGLSLKFISLTPTLQGGLEVCLFALLRLLLPALSFSRNVTGFVGFGSRSADIIKRGAFEPFAAEHAQELIIALECQSALNFAPALPH